MSNKENYAQNHLAVRFSYVGVNFGNNTYVFLIYFVSINYLPEEIASPDYFDPIQKPLKKYRYHNPLKNQET